LHICEALSGATHIQASAGEHLSNAHENTAQEQASVHAFLSPGSLDRKKRAGPRFERETYLANEDEEIGAEAERSSHRQRQRAREEGSSRGGNSGSLEYEANEPVTASFADLLREHTSPSRVAASRRRVAYKRRVSAAYAGQKKDHSARDARPSVQGGINFEVHANEIVNQDGYIYEPKMILLMQC
jgi:hypothetical protein